MTSRLVRLFFALITLSSASIAEPARPGAPVYVAAGADVTPTESGEVRRAAAKVRSLRQARPLPSQKTQSMTEVARQHRIQALKLALDRAIAAEGKADFDTCVREAANALDDATTLLGDTGNLEMLRSLHLQIGSCMVLGPKPANAKPHFATAFLLDEQLPSAGRYREEVERALTEARDEIRDRSRGRVTVESEPPGAEVWIDGRRIAGKTPLVVEVRLGEHFVTLRRFRFEPRTARTLLVPSSRVRFALEPAGRQALGMQLLDSTRGPSRQKADELLLARAAWAGADQVLVARRSATGPSALSLRLVDATSGQLVRTGVVSDAHDLDDLSRAVCRTLGASCEPKRGIPWYVWPIGGAALVGGVVAAVLIADKNRDVRFCPPSGCR